MNTPCISWAGAIDRDGYGRFGRQLAHRIVYEDAIGAIPDGLTLDHLCRNRSCVNPTHLEPVTRRVNTLRGVGPTAANAVKTHCDRGHALFGPNLGWRKGTADRRYRVCRRCDVMRHVALHHRRAPA